MPPGGPLAMAKSTKPPTGKPKQKSGAQKRREKAEREAAARQYIEQQARAVGVKVEVAAPPPRMRTSALVQPPSPPAPPADEPVDDGLSEFDKLGPPPLDNPETALAWVRRYQLTALHVAATKPLSDALEKRLRYVREFGATIGMTQNRADLEELAEKLETSLATARQTVTTLQRPVTGGDRPPTSRGGARGRGPRPVDEPSR